MDQRVGSLEREMHTLAHRVTAIEERMGGIPERVTRIEAAVSRLPDIERSIRDQGQQIQRGFTLTHGILIGAGLFWTLFQAGPEILKMLGGR